MQARVLEAVFEQRAVSGVLAESRGIAGNVDGEGRENGSAAMKMFYISDPREITYIESMTG